MFRENHMTHSTLVENLFWIETRHPQAPTTMIDISQKQYGCYLRDDIRCWNNMSVRYSMHHKSQRSVPTYREGSHNTSTATTDSHKVFELLIAAHSRNGHPDLTHVTNKARLAQAQSPALERHKATQATVNKGRTAPPPPT